MEALDPDMGIGYPSKNNTSVLSPLVDDWVFPQQKLEGFNKFQSILFQKVVWSIDQKRTEIELTDKDVKEMRANWEDLPATICVMIEIIKAESQDLLIKWNSCGGSSGANLLARFAGSSSNLVQLILSSKEPLFFLATQIPLYRTSLFSYFSICLHDPLQLHCSKGI